jgi:CheY-like chemotaxis protein
MSITGGREDMRILIADDDPWVAEILAQRCKQLGFRVETAINGIMAASTAVAFEPDILVVDVRMPAAGGFSVASHLREQSKKSVEVIAISGHFGPPEAERWAGLGALCVDKGSNFWVKFADALIELCPSLANISEQMGAFDAEVRTQATVLLVDDDKSTRDFLSNRFKILGIDPLVAPNGVRALQLAKSENPAVIITDYSMTNGDAEYLLKKLRLAQETRHIPVIVHTGRELDEQVRGRLTREILGAPGVAHIVRKSHHAQNLFHTLKAHCGFLIDPATHFEKPIALSA